MCILHDIYLLELSSLQGQHIRSTEMDPNLKKVRFKSHTLSLIC